MVKMHTMRSLNSRNSFKTPFLQKRPLTVDGKKIPCTLSRPYQLRHEELSPLHLGGRLQTVTPKTRKQILKKLASSMQRQNVTVSSTMSSPGITFPFDSQPDPKAALHQSIEEEDVNTTTLTEDGLSGEEFDLELSPGNSKISRQVKKREYVKSKSNKTVYSYESIETTAVINEIVIPDEEHAYKLICSEAGKKSDDTFFKFTLNEEGMKENQAVITEVNTLNNNDCRTKENMDTDRFKKAPSNKKKTCIVENKNSKKMKGKATEPNCIVTKRAVIKMKAMSPDVASSERKKKAENSLLTAYVATVQSSVKHNKLKPDKLKKTSSNKKNSTQQQYKSRMQVKQDVVKMIRKMHLEIERLLKKKPYASKIGSTTKTRESGMILLTEE